jgi:heme exporter protein D
MNWNSLSDFFAMGGYGLYVWGSYLMGAVVLAWEGLLLVQRRRRALSDLRDRELLAEDRP